MVGMCEIPGCGQPAGLFVREQCSAHGDAVIDRLREAGLSPRRASSAQVTEGLVALTNQHAAMRTRLREGQSRTGPQ